MQLKDRQATNPNRVKLRNVSTGVEAVYDVVVESNFNDQGTILNSATIENFKQDIVNDINRLCGGSQGDKGARGETGATVVLVSISKS